MRAFISLLLPALISSYAHLEPFPCFQDRALYWLSVSSGVRINQYGMFFFHTPVLHSGDSAFACERSIDGLCETANYTFFPCTTMPRTFVSDAPPPFEKLWYDEAKCSKYPSYTHFDVMPCDLAGRDTTILWADGQISIHYNTGVPHWPKLAIGLIMVWLVINLGESVALLLEVDGSRPQNHVTSSLCLVLVFLIVLYTPVDVVYVTHNERLVYRFVLAYIFSYSVYHIRNPNTINVIVGCMLLVTSRVYQTAETPYVPSFMFMIAARLVQKAFLQKHQEPDSHSYSVARFAFMLLDVVMLVAQYQVGFADTFRDTLQAPLCVVGLFFSAFCLGRSVVSSL